MRLATLVLSLAMLVTACAKKPAPQSPKSNTAGTTDGAAAPAAETKATPDTADPAPPAGDDAASHSRGPVPKGGASKSGDPCEGGQ